MAKKGLIKKNNIIGDRVTESQSDRHSRVPSIRVGEIFLCLISINSPTRFARRGITFFVEIDKIGLSRYFLTLVINLY